MFGRLDDDGTGGVVAGAPGPPRDLMELAGSEQSASGAVVLGKRREDYGANWHVDADAEGVGAADRLEQAGLGQLFHQPPVLWQHPGVMHADAVPDESRQGGTKGGREPEPADRVGDRRFFLPGTHVDAHQCLRPLQRRSLGEMDDVDRRPLGVEQFADGFVHRGGRIAVEQRHRALGVGDQRRWPAGPSGEVFA